MARTDVDPRVLRTREQLQSALLDVGARKPFATITVADLVGAAGLSRSTFYDHYPDVEALLLSTLHMGVEAESSQAGMVHDGNGGPPAVVVRFLTHIERHLTLYRSALGDQGSTSVIHALRRRIELDMHPFVGPSSTGPPELPHDIAAAAVSGLIVGIVFQWLDMEPRPSVDLAANWIWAALPWKPPGRTHTDSQS